MNKKELWMKSIKITLAALLAIFIAGELGLKNSATAGIITVLSIQNTKRETLRSAVNRGLAYICALFLAACAFTVFGFTLAGFGVFLLFFALLCYRLGWSEAITMDAVLVTHFLAEQSMSTAMISNETALFVIGTGVGILVNLHLHRKEKEFDRLADVVDTQIREILRGLGRMLLSEAQGETLAETTEVRDEALTGERGALAEACEESSFAKLTVALKQAELCAAANYNNELFHKNTDELDYIHMREKQGMVLQDIYENIRLLGYLPVQAQAVAVLIKEIEEDYHRSNRVVGLLNRTDQLFQEMKKATLPHTREEFEARAILFYILMQIHKLLRLKREYIEKKSVVK